MGMKSCRKHWFAILCAVMVACVHLSGIVSLTGALGEAIESETYTVPSSLPTADTTAVPLPDACNTPEPSANPNASGSVEVLAPAAIEPSAAEALSAYSLYLDSDHMVCADQTVTLKLVLVAGNASGTPLKSFGIRFNLPSDMPFKVSSINGADLVRFSRQTLWVEGAIVQDGRVTVKGEDLRLSLSFQPFPTDSELTGTSVSIVLLNDNGNEIELKEYEQGEAIIHLSVIYQRDEQNEPAAEPSKTENTLEPAASAPDQQPLQSDQQPVTPSNDALQFLTVEPDDPEMTESSEDLAKQALPEKTMEAELPATRPEPMPTVQRQLQLTANILYCDLKIGDILILTAQITGYEGLKTHIQWQQRTKDEWLNIEGENGDTLTLLITPENFHCAWRYDVTVEQ